MIYTWKPGVHKAGDSQVVGERLEALRVQAGGTLATRDVVVDARDDASPLHKFFEWRDNVAATKYRERQAQELIRSVIVIHEDAPDKELPAFVSIGPNETEFSRYVATRVALENADTRDYLLAQALSMLAAWRRRYSKLEGFSVVVSAIDEALAAHQVTVEAAA